MSLILCCLPPFLLHSFQRYTLIEPSVHMFDTHHAIPHRKQVTTKCAKLTRCRHLKYAAETRISPSTLDSSFYSSGATIIASRSSGLSNITASFESSVTAGLSISTAAWTDLLAAFSGSSVSAAF